MVIDFHKKTLELNGEMFQFYFYESFSNEDVINIRSNNPNPQYMRILYNNMKIRSHLISGSADVDIADFDSGIQKITELESNKPFYKFNPKGDKI